MLKTGLIAIMAIVILHSDGMAQVVVKSGGNVGIGTSTPATKLDVNGVLTAGSANGGYHLIVNDIPSARWALGTGNYGFHIANDYPVTTTWAEKFVISRDGNVGIGVANPTAKLELINAGNASLRVGVSSNMANTHTQLIHSLAVVGENPTSTTSSGAVSYDFYNNGNNPSWAGTMLFHYGNGFGTGETLWGVPKKNLGALHFQNESNGLIVSSGKIFVMPEYTANPTIFHGSGNVSIGFTTNHNPGYRLEVNGTIWASNFRAQSGNNYPDYVFDSTYQLRTLNEVESYIKQNHHLPEVPSEAEVKKDGIDLTSHQVILLKKVEELTLYAIEQNKKIQQLENKMAEVMEVNDKLKEDLIHVKSKRKRDKRK